MLKQDGNTVFDESLRESLSALVDGEATELEARRVLANIDSDEEVRATWSRYHVASRAMSGEPSAFSGVDLSAKISAALADEPAHSIVEDAPANSNVASKRGSVGFLGQVGKVAIAASVAAVAVFAVNQYSAQPDSSAPAAGIAAANPVNSVDLSNSAADLPMGYGTPGINARTVSTESNPLEQRRHNAVPVQFVPRTESASSNPAVQEFLRQLMAEHANVGAETQSGLPFERVPRIVTESETAAPQ